MIVCKEISLPYNLHGTVAHTMLIYSFIRSGWVIYWAPAETWQQLCETAININSQASVPTFIVAQSVCKWRDRSSFITPGDIELLGYMTLVYLRTTFLQSRIFNFFFTRHEILKLCCYFKKWHFNFAMSVLLHCCMSVYKSYSLQQIQSPPSYKIYEFRID